MNPAVFVVIFVQMGTIRYNGTLRGNTGCSSYMNTTRSVSSAARKVSGSWKSRFTVIVSASNASFPTVYTVRYSARGPEMVLPPDSLGRTLVVPGLRLSCLRGLSSAPTGYIASGLSPLVLVVEAV